QGETIGALLGEHLGRAPRRGERIQVGAIRFEVLRADATQALLLRTERLPGSVSAATPAAAAPAVPAAAVPAATPSVAAPAAASAAGTAAATASTALGAEQAAAQALAFDAHAAMSAPGAKMRRAKRAGTTVAHGS